MLACATLPNQLTAAGLTWKGYIQDMGNDAAREDAVCARLALNTRDQTQSAVPGDPDRCAQGVLLAGQRQLLAGRSSALNTESAGEGRADRCRAR